jgi:hypothetical protein
MADFRTIEIDFDIHKLIENERQSFSETPNAALRRLLDLPPQLVSSSQVKTASGERAWFGEGVRLLHGTKLRMRLNGRQYEGEIVDGKWLVEGKIFNSPSGAAGGVALTKKGHKTKLDGWIYWEVKGPSEASWTSLNKLRADVAAPSKVSLADIVRDL